MTKRFLVFVSVVLAFGISAILFPPVAVGAVSIIQHGHAATIDHTGSTVTCALTATGAGRNIIVGAVATTSGVSALSVSSVTDNQGNVYSPASGSRGVYEYVEVEVWHALNAVAGVTSLTVTFSGTPGYYRECFVFEVAGAVTFDTAAKVDSGTCVANVCTGASITTATTTGFVLGIVGADPVDQNPLAGNEFVSGGDIGLNGSSAAASLVSSTAAPHRPAWHSDRDGQHFASSTVAYKQ